MPGDSAATGAGADGSATGADAGGGTPEGGSASDGGKVLDPFGGPDTCGNGIDDDGNGVVDDGCQLPSCPLTVKTFELPTENFDDGGSASLAVDAASNRLASTASRSPSGLLLRLFSLDDGTLVQEATASFNVSTGAALRVPGGWFPVPWPTSGFTKFDDALLPTAVPGSGAVLMGAQRIYGSDGFFYTFADTAGPTTWRTYDTSLVADPLQHQTIEHPAAKRIFSAGGIPIIASRRLYDPNATTLPNVYSFQNVALKRGAERWHGAVVSGAIDHVYAISEPTRSGNEIATCASGVVKSGSSGLIRIVCHFQDAQTGSVSRAAVTKDHPFVLGVSGELVSVKVAPLADGWAIVRYSTYGTGLAGEAPTTATADVLHANGTYETGVASWSFPNSADLERILELGPKGFVVLSSTKLSGQVRKALFTVVRCAN